MKTKYPLLIVPGIIIKNVLFFNSFGKIPKVLINVIEIIYYRLIKDK